MKKTISHRILLMGILSPLLFLFSGCEHNVTVSSKVYPDGSIDRTIVLHNADSAKSEQNFFGANRNAGWDVVISNPTKPSTESDNRNEVNITFKKHFSSVEELNKETNPDHDTVFHVASSFEKDNRWFYTYVEYRDTYKALNLFKTIPKEEYFTKEDFAFINRLPAEGTTISKADSLYLARLNEKIFDLYGSRTIFEEIFRHTVVTLNEHDVASQWIDTLTRKKEELYHGFVRAINLEDGALLSTFDQLNIPMSGEVRASMQQKADDIEKRLEFMSEVYSGKFVHSIEMPWTIMESNADSVINNQLYWRPPVVKFLLTDYTMSAKSRRLNVAAVAISALIVGATIGLFFFARKASPAASM